MGIVVALLGGATGSCRHGDDAPAVRENEGPTLRTIELPGASLSVAVGEGAVWVANFEDSSVLRIDPRSLEVVAEIPVGLGPFSVATGEGAVWVV